LTPGLTPLLPTLRDLYEFPPTPLVKDLFRNYGALLCEEIAAFYIELKDYGRS
jgi:hypothetical protein